MSFPNHVFKTPGVHHGHTGTYDFKAVRNQEELDNALSSGWYLSIQDAIDRVEYSPNDGVEIGPDYSAAPTREEMEIKARELDLKFDGRTSDRKLLEMINAAISEE